ncbi:hypothetical protein Tco_0327868 [Tanacetum coccineum]
MAVVNDRWKVAVSSVLMAALVYGGSVSGANKEWCSGGWCLSSAGTNLWMLAPECTLVHGPQVGRRVELARLVFHHEVVFCCQLVGDMIAPQSRGKREKERGSEKGVKNKEEKREVVRETGIVTRRGGGGGQRDSGVGGRAREVRAARRDTRGVAGRVERGGKGVEGEAGRGAMARSEWTDGRNDVALRDRRVLGQGRGEGGDGGEETAREGDEWRGGNFGELQVVVRVNDRRARTWVTDAAMGAACEGRRRKEVRARGGMGLMRRGRGSGEAQGTGERERDCKARYGSSGRGVAKGDSFRISTDFDSHLVALEDGLIDGYGRVAYRTPLCKSKRGGLKTPTLMTYLHQFEVDGNLSSDLSWDRLPKSK